MKVRTVFLVDDDPFFLELEKQVISGLGAFKFETFTNGSECIARLYEKPFLILLDHHLGNEYGLDILKQIKFYNPQSLVIYVSGQADIETAVNALKFGAFDYIVKEDFCGPFLMPTLEKISVITEMIEAKEKKKRSHRMAASFLTLGLSYLFWRE